MSLFLKFIFLISDLFFLNLSIILSFGLGDGNYLDTTGNNELYLILFSNIGWIFLVLVSNPYSLSKGWSVSKIFKSQIAFLFVHILIIFSLVVFFQKEFFDYADNFGLFFFHSTFLRVEGANNFRAKTLY
ncbi:MAG: hypothetical protein IPJ20_21865 [Flammeovirgaceae bacterium]|nr:hypothetical protein [Flammeovirgaceae bacterium]